VPKCKHILFSRKPHNQILTTLSGILPNLFAIIPFYLTGASLGFAWPDRKKNGIVQGAGPNVEVGRIRPAGLSLGTTALKHWLHFSEPEVAARLKYNVNVSLWMKTATGVWRGLPGVAPLFSSTHQSDSFGVLAVGLEVISSYQQGSQQQASQQQGNQHQLRVLPPARYRLLHIGLMTRMRAK